MLVKLLDGTLADLHTEQKNEEDANPPTKLRRLRASSSKWKDLKSNLLQLAEIAEVALGKPMVESMAFNGLTPEEQVQIVCMRLGTHSAYNLPRKFWNEADTMEGLSALIRKRKEQLGG